MPVGIVRSPSRRDGRTRLLDGAAELLAERGYEATELRDVAERGDAPRGSIYHHFPDGKVQLAAEAAERRGQQIAEVVERSLADAGTVATVRLFAELFRKAADGDPARLGCPVGAVAQGTDPRLRAAAATAFARWEAVIARGLEGEGVPAAQSTSLAALALSTVEGALVLARARGDMLALDEAMQGLETVLLSVIGRQGPAGGGDN
jgi:AcrR family transcriptional regulator